MATAVTSQKVASTHAIEAYDHDPGATTATVVTNGTLIRWVPMRDFGVFAVLAKPSIVAAGGLTLVEIVGATDSAGSDIEVILSSGTVAADALDDYVFLEVTDEQVNEVGNAAGHKFTHVAARLTMATNTDEASVVYIRWLPKRAYNALTANNITA